MNLIKRMSLRDLLHAYDHLTSIGSTINYFHPVEPPSCRPCPDPGLYVMRGQGFRPAQECCVLQPLGGGTLELELLK